MAEGGDLPDVLFRCRKCQYYLDSLTSAYSHQQQCSGPGAPFLDVNHTERAPAATGTAEAAPVNDALVDPAAVLVKQNIHRRQEQDVQEGRLQSSKKIKLYAVATVPRFSGEDFVNHFRMQRENVEELCRLLAPHLTTKILPISKKVMATLWWLGNLESLHEVGGRFNLSGSTLEDVIFEVSRALKAIEGVLMVWPRDDQLPQLANDFMRSTNMPGVIGVINSTQIEIPDPPGDRYSYLNKRGLPSIQLQAVCDSKLRFLSTCSRWPGSVSGATIFRYCRLKTMIEDGKLPQDYHLLANASYALETYMMVPFRGKGHLLPWQKHFNDVLSSSRVVTERAFCLLRSKFRRLKKLEFYDIRKLPQVIAATCLLHNFVLMKENLSSNVQQAQQQDPVQLKVVHVQAQESRAAAVEKREQLAHYLARFM